PLIVSQPTTPIESPLVNRRMTPRERRDAPRRVADRALAMRGSGSSLAWIWVVVAVLGGIGGGLYYYKSRGFATGVELEAASANAAGTPATADTAGSTRPVDSAPATPSAPPAPRT